MSIFNNNILAGAAAQSSGSAVHTIDQSIRFNDNDSAYMTRTPSSAGNRRTWTWSAWLKRGNITSTMQLFNAGANDSNNSRFQINSDDVISYVHADSGSVTDQIKTNMKIRDTAAWYNIQLVADTTNEVETERLRLYVNGQRISDLATTNYPTLNFDTDINNTEVHNIGRLFSNTQYLDGYLAEIVFIDGTALDPSSFGEYNSSGIWIPKDVSGLTFGTNGFHIKGEDSSDLGNDSSGNNNDYTTSGLAAHDQVADSPTNNFCTYNSIQLQSGATLSDGNLDAVSSGSSWRNVHSTIGVSSGKWYWEVKADVINSSQTWIAGIQETSFESKTNYWWQAGYTASSSGIVFGVLDSNYKVTNVTRTSFTHDIAQGDIVQFQLNLDDNELSVLVDGVSKGKIYDITANTEYTPAVCLYSTSSATINFGQDGTFGGTETAGGNSDGNGIGNFKYSVPSGYLALCTKNLGS